MAPKPRPNFRRWPKRMLRVLIPEELDKALAIRASEQGRPENEVAAEALSIGLGIEPSRFGIDPASATMT